MKCSQIVCMKTVTYPLRLSHELYAKVQREAGKRHKKLSELMRDIIVLGLPELPPMPDDMSELAEDTWEKLGPSPTVNYDEL